MKKESPDHSAPLKVPCLLYGDDQGRIFEDPALEVAGRSGTQALKLIPEDFIKLPAGARLFHLPGRSPVGFHRSNGKKVTKKEGWAVAVSNLPGYTQTYLSAFEKKPDAPVLPLFAYTAVGWWRGDYYTAAIRVDKDIKHDPGQFKTSIVHKAVTEKIRYFPENRLIGHLGQNCALKYECANARNLFLNRWECPIPISPACNARCLGCISEQPPEHGFPSTQNRLNFSPRVEEILEIAVPHLQNAPRAIVSFGQGCEGEPLLQWKMMSEIVRKIRSQTDRGIINMNTNGSKPAAVEVLCQAGLDSIRVSLNSAQKEIYERYYLPKDYGFEDILESLKIVRKFGGWSSINYFTFPGLNDTPQEFAALRHLIRATGLNMIQWRNFNIDPDWYLKKINIGNEDQPIGIRRLMQKLKEEFPDLLFGYFNPPAEVIEQRLKKPVSLQRI